MCIDKPKVVSRSQKSKADDLVFITMMDFHHNNEILSNDEFSTIMNFHHLVSILIMYHQINEFSSNLSNLKREKNDNTHDWNNDKPYECGLETLDGG